MDREASRAVPPHSNRLLQRQESGGIDLTPELCMIKGARKNNEYALQYSTVVRS